MDALGKAPVDLRPEPPAAEHDALLAALAYERAERADALTPWAAAALREATERDPQA